MSRTIYPVLLCLFMALTQKAFSNVQLFPGYYIDKNGDSVSCKIDYKDWNRNPGTILVEVNNTQKTLGPADIKGFGVTGYVDYLSASVTYHPGPIQGSDLPTQYSEKTETTTCFLRVLVSGPYSLYELMLAQRDYLFLGEPGGMPAELVYRVRQTDAMVSEDEQYKVALTGYLQKEQLSAEIPSVRIISYSKTKIIPLVERLNEAHTGQKVVVPARKRIKHKDIQLDVFGGAVMNMFPTTFNTEFGTAKFPSTIAAAGGVSLHIVMPAHFNAFSVGLTLGYTSFQSNTTTSGTAKTNILSNSWYDEANYKENLSVSNTMFTTNIFFMYLIPSAAEIRFYGKVGVNADFLLKSTGNVFTQWSASYTAHHTTNPPYPDGGNSATDQVAGFEAGAVDAQFAVGSQMGRNRIELFYNSQRNLAGLTDQTFKLANVGVLYYFTIIK